MRAPEARQFRHALLRDAAYQLQLRGDRARLHALAFAAIEDLAGGRAPQPAPLASGSTGAFSPHPTDTVAESLAGHALGAAMPAERRLYLRRAAETAGREFRSAIASGLWLSFSQGVTGLERLEAINRAGTEAARAGALAQARAIYLRAYRMALRQSHPRFKALILVNLSTVLKDLGNVDRAGVLLRASLPVLRRAGDRRSEATALLNLGNLYRAIGRPREARDAYRGAAALYRAERDCREGSSLTGLGLLDRDAGRLARSARFLRRALAIHRAAFNRRSEGIALESLATVHSETGRFGRAERAFRQALEIHREVGDARAVAILLGSLATLYRQMGRFEESERVGLAALAANREASNRRSEGVVLGNLGNLYGATGRLGEAGTAFERALALHREARNRRGEGLVEASLAALLWRQGRHADAERRHAAAIAAFRDLRDPRLEGKELCAHALRLLRHGDLARARSALRRGAGLLSRTDPAAHRAAVAAFGSACAEAGLPGPVRKRSRTPPPRSRPAASPKPSHA